MTKPSMLRSPGSRRAEADLFFEDLMGPGGSAGEGLDAEDDVASADLFFADLVGGPGHRRVPSAEADGSSEVTLTTPAFRTAAYPDPLRANAKLQAALDRAIAAGPGTSWRTAVTLVALESDGSRPLASFKGDEVHFSGSLLKVGAMYAAFELRNTLQNIAAELGTSTTQAGLLQEAAAYLDPKILARAASIPALGGITRKHALPLYASMFAVAPLSSGGFAVSFSSAFLDHLQKMIAQSVNASAAQCVHACGYGYLNGALASAGFFDPSTNNGVWLAGDFIQDYPYFRIMSVNDKLVAQAMTTRKVALMYTLMNDGALVGTTSSVEMLDLLAKAVAVPETFISRASGLSFTVTHTKVGLAPLKPENGGNNVWSEASIVRHTSGRRFVVVWQNFVAGTNGFDPIGRVVTDALDAFVKP